MMKIKHVNTSYIKWLSAEEMHNDSKEWRLELEFLNDEYLFFEDLIKWNTLQLIDFQSYDKSKEIIEKLSNSIKTNDALIQLVQKHENNLEVIEPEGDKQKETYKNEHKTLLILFKNHLKEHRELKLNLFDVLKKIKKEEKQKRIIDVE
ncbi:MULTISPECIES: hypothetical protein [Polaribacter]|uniref:Uncharacterized protein n=1 Tax=Polaribacter sejongensis TaxID=985043 RepID=A0AAJ1QUG8_9FLAO|nr:MULTISPECIES: hypothetical protein [Polaribacter]MDN3618295.1 hypothetical protein [Polaribacter undariae]UWD30717.1 hypothetical protein NQP51_11275 [Polaribacter undariae]